METIIELAREQRVKLPSFDVDELRRLVSVDENCGSLTEYLRGFDISLAVLQKEYAITRAMFEVCEDAAQDGIAYLEVRFSPILHTKNGLSLSSVMNAVIKGKEMAELMISPRIVVRIIVCGMRQMDPSVSARLAEIAWRYKSQGVVAFDLAGPEDGFSSKVHREAFHIIHKNLLYCTLHSGEADGWKSVSEALRHCGAQRIGHGVRARENPDIIQFLATNRIPIEVCLTSNIQTKAVKSRDDHPVREFFDAGLVVVPCTDNVTVSGVTLSEEYLKLQESFNFTPAEIVRLIDFGFRSAFLEPHTKRLLRAQALRKIAKVLTDRGFSTTDIFDKTQHLRIGAEFPELQIDVDDRSCVSIPIISSGPQLTTQLYFNEEKKRILHEFIRRMPKADVNVRLAGSVSIDTLWQLYTGSKKNGFDIDRELMLSARVFPGEISSKEDLRRLCQPDNVTRSTARRAKSIMACMLQTREAIEQGMEDIFHNAAADNVRYFELHVRPTQHCLRGLSVKQVMDIVIAKKKSLRSKYSTLDCVIVVYIEFGSDGMDQCMQVARIAVDRKRDVKGFGWYWFEDVTELTRQQTNVFRLLKDHAVNIIMATGFKDPDSIVPCLVATGASRLSGCFAIHDRPDIMQYVAQRGISIEMGDTHTSHYFTHKIRSYQDSEIRLMRDQFLSICPASFDKTLYARTMSDIIFSMSQSAKFTVPEIVRICLSAIRHCFHSYRRRKEIMAKALDEAEELQKEFHLELIDKLEYYAD